jgi:predicted nucleic acid-binding protein
MKPVFADTYYFIALLNPADQDHERAVRWTAESSRAIVTTEFVLMEVADGMAKFNRRSVFGQCHRIVTQSSGIRLVSASHELFERGVEMYLSRMDQEWTLTDCISFVVMRDLGLTEALTADHHFEQARMVPLFRPQE